MANSNQRNQQIAELAAGVVADNQVIKDELSGLIQDIIKYQRLVMRTGAPADKIALTKAILPQMLAAMNTVAQSEAEAEERAAYDRMRATLRGEHSVETMPVSLKAV
jgi:hypothetical protein